MPPFFLGEGVFFLFLYICRKRQRVAAGKSIKAQEKKKKKRADEFNRGKNKTQKNPNWSGRTKDS